MEDLKTQQLSISKILIFEKTLCLRVFVFRYKK